MAEILLSEQKRRDREREEKEALDSLLKSDEDLLKEIFYVSSLPLDQNPVTAISRTTAYFSTLLIKLSRQSEESTKQTITLTEKTMDYTKQLYRLTVAIVILTVVLIFQGFFEFPKITFKCPQNAKQETQNTK